MADTAKVVVKSGFSRAIHAFFEYDTPKIVHIKSKKVGVINRFIQLVILAYIIGYAIVYQKGYQDFDPVESAALTKVKGVAYTVYDRDIPGISNRTWDVADYTIPPEEVDAFFVMTNMVVTPNQTQGVCAEDPDLPNVICTTSDDCKAGEPVVNGNGVRTGDCIPSREPNISTCAIHAWCDVEVDQWPDPDNPVLSASTNFTVLIKNWIEFPKFGRKRRNIIDTVNNETYLQTCRYDADDPLNRFCPIFTLGTIVREAGVKNYSDIAYRGGVIAINIHWDCNLDFDISNCKPRYSFSRLDDPNAPIAKGWNFRYANYYYKDGVYMRDLIKSAGIRFVLKVTGQAGKFSIVPLLLNLGSGVGLLAIATVLCDIIVLYILKGGEFFQQKKYLYVTAKDALKLGGDDREDDNETGIENNEGPSESITEEPSNVVQRNRVGQYDRFE